MSRVIPVRGIPRRSIPKHGGRVWMTVAVAAGVGLALAAPVASAAVAAPAAPPKWHVVKTVKTDVTGDFTAMVATGRTTGWAFDGLGQTSKATAWRENGTTWTKAAFPSVAGEQVVAADATSPKDVWVFTQNLIAGPSRVLRWNGSKWSVVKTFPDAIADATVVSGSDVWVYGDAPEPFENALGVWFYNGTKWTQVSKTIQGGSALSDKNVWGYSGASVEHWTGTKWVATSLKSLLPAKNSEGLNSPSVVGVLALSASNVYALGNGNAEDEGGPTVVLHYNGSTWARLATGQFGYGPGPQFSSDGKGGLWLPMDGPGGGTSYLVHYANGKLTKATLPVSAPLITIGAVARIPGTAAQLAGGFTHAADNRGTNIVAVLLQYS
jgi:hypothetical protein